MLKHCESGKIYLMSFVDGQMEGHFYRTVHCWKDSNVFVFQLNFNGCPFTIRIAISTVARKNSLLTGKNFKQEQA